MQLNHLHQLLCSEMKKIILVYILIYLLSKNHTQQNLDTKATIETKQNQNKLKILNNNIESIVIHKVINR